MLKPDLIEWLQQQHRKLLTKLANVGLIPQVEQAPTMTLVPFLSDYIAKHGPAVKPATVTTWIQAKSVRYARGSKIGLKTTSNRRTAPFVRLGSLGWIADSKRTVPPHLV